MTASFTETRQPVVAGQFYARSPDRLAASIAECLGDRPERADRRMIGLIAPHAGYSFSGKTAGRAYVRVEGADAWQRIVLLAPSHTCSFRGVSSGSYASFRTPLGDVPVDVAACRDLPAGSSLFSHSSEPHEAEHSLEVQLPFLQTVLPGLPIVPLVCGRLDDDELVEAARTLAREFGASRTLWVVSSDFTHYGHSFGFAPFESNVLARIRDLDGGALDCIAALDWRRFREYLRETGATICGATPIALFLAVLEAAGQWVDAELLDYTSSGQLLGDENHSVSYAAVAFRGRGDPSGPRPPAEEDLSADDRRRLLELARAAIAAELGKGERPTLPGEGLSPALSGNGACFVTLHRRGTLRGCMGDLDAREPLCMNVIGNARNAAFRDPRFKPLAETALAETTIEISVLGPARDIPSAEAFVPGTHGIVLSKGRHRAVYLPRVAEEHGWDRETTLRRLALKAGLRAAEWRRAKLAIFEAFTFGEKSPPPAAPG